MSKALEVLILSPKSPREGLTYLNKLLFKKLDSIHSTLEIIYSRSKGVL